MLEYGHGVTLRRIEEDDLGNLFTWRNDPNVFKYTRQNAPLHRSGHRDWFVWQSKDPKTSMFVVCTPDGKSAGVVGLTSIDHLNRHAEFSCYIAPNSQKKGLGKAALKTLFDYGFKVLGLNLIWGETFEGNPAVKTFEAVGMTKHGTRPDFYFRNGKFIDAHLFGILEKSWNK